MSKVANLFFACCACLVVFVACDKSSEPKKDVDPATLIASGTIGAAGGEIGTDDLRLTVPAGAFEGDAELKLYSLKTENPFAGYGAANAFRISGLPADYSIPLRAAIKYTGQLTANSYLAVGLINPIAISDAPETVYVLVVATDSSGYLIADLAASSPTGKAPLADASHALGTADDGSVVVTAVTNFDPPLTTSRNHFIVHMPADLDPQVKNFLPKDLESALDTINGCGFNLNLLSWPMEVFVAPLNCIDINRCGVFLPYRGRYYLLLSLDKLKDPVDNYMHVSAAAGRELFQAMLTKYDPDYFEPGTLRPNLDNYWFHVAVSLWAESRFRMNVDYRPPQFFGGDYMYRGERGRAPFRGVNYATLMGGNTYAVYEHGCGMTGMIKYLVDHYGRSFLLPTYQEMYARGTNPVNALLGKLSDPSSVWWPAFLQEYTAGGIFEYDPLGHWGHYDDGLYYLNQYVFRIDGPEDSLAVWVEDLRDLSACPFYIELQYPQIDSTSMLQVTLEVDPALQSDVTMTTYAYVRDPNTYVHSLLPLEGTGRQQTFRELRRAMREGILTFVPVVCNSCYEKPGMNELASVTVIAELLKQQLKYNQCDILFKFTSRIITNGEYFTWETSKWWRGVGGVFVGKDFIAGLDPEAHFDETGTIKITIDPRTLTITGFEISTERHDGTLYEHWEITSNGMISLPATWVSPFNDAQENDLTGTNVCSMIAVEMIHQQPGTIQSIESISCNEQSEISVSLLDTNAK